MAINEMKKVIIENGVIRVIYTDEMIKAMQSKDFEIERASHVDYDNQLKKWTVKGIDNSLLGAYDTRKEALAHEVDMLYANNILPLTAESKKE